MTGENLRISAERLQARLEALGAVGATPEGGVRRLALTDEDKAGRDLVVHWMESAGMTVQVDRLGNIFATRPGREDLSPIMTGSHIDTVYNGGKLDGNLGVLTGLEVVETLNAAGLETRAPAGGGGLHQRGGRPLPAGHDGLTGDRRWPSAGRGLGVRR